jgi:hypothetical protein
MLKTVAVSGNSKTGKIAVTYRSGEHSIFGTCPKTCALNPKGAESSNLVDTDYLEALSDAVPRGGKAWTYSHFARHVLPKPAAGRTVINVSSDAVADAVASVRDGYPTVYAAPADSAEQWPKTVDGVRFVRCPAELAETFTCKDCGNGSPLCARGDRDYVVVFVGHSTYKELVGSDREGGCYAAAGFVAMQWRATKKQGRADDVVAVRAFAAGLPEGSLLRHHVAGDIGRST